MAEVRFRDAAVTPQAAGVTLKGAVKAMLKGTTKGIVKESVTAAVIMIERRDTARLAIMTA